MTSTGGSKSSGKLMRMKEQERIRYLEKRQAEEQEMRRRKDQLIRSFVNMKVESEGKYFKDNDPKIMNKWRAMARQSKSHELAKDLKLLGETFIENVNGKSSHIQRLMDTLSTCDSQYNLAFTTHLTRVDELIGNHNKRMNDLFDESYKKEVAQKFVHFHKRWSEKIDERENELKTYLDAVEKKVIERHETTRNQMMKENNDVQTKIKNNLRMEREEMEEKLDEKLKTVWKTLQQKISSAKTQNEEKIRTHKELVAKDQQGFIQIGENDEKIEHLKSERRRLKTMYENICNKTKKNDVKLNDSVKKFKESENEDNDQEAKTVSTPNNLHVAKSKRNLAKLAVTLDNFEIELDKGLEMQRKMLFLIDKLKKEKADIHLLYDDDEAIAEAENDKVEQEDSNLNTETDYVTTLSKWDEMMKELSLQSSRYVGKLKVEREGVQSRIEMMNARLKTIKNTLDSQMKYLK